MSENIIYFITEGATEREVGRVLYERGLLQGAEPRPGFSRKGYDRVRREGYDNVINAMKAQNVLQVLEKAPGLGLLLVFDQDEANSPADRADKLGDDLGLSFTPIEDCECGNLFEAGENGLKIVLHVSNASSGSIENRDFDGYILNLLQGSFKEEIARKISDFRDVSELLRKSEHEITELMQNNGYPWKRNKSWLYAYITAFQFRQSHVWFAEQVVQVAPERELRRVFRPLINAWSWLVNGGCS